ncbi:hypothetical protein [Halocatena halophila]|uniref:hypothetical protein n=1 Tax=Halocatena halophila TaxID=2814576 RepID=UPI002ED45D5C
MNPHDGQEQAPQLCIGFYTTDNALPGSVPWINGDEMRSFLLAASSLAEEA